MPEALAVLYEYLSDPEHSSLDRMTAARLFLEGLRMFQLALVAAAREQGASWRQIGRALEISGQAAHQRYATVDPCAR